MLLTKSNNANIENTSQYYFNNTDNAFTQSNIESELTRLKEEEKLLQTALEIKFRKELIYHLERDQQIENLKNTSILNNSLHSDQEERNMTTTHLLFHKITNECPICEKNTVNGLIISSGNERSINKTFGSSSITKFQNKPEPEKKKPNVVFSQAYKNARPQYVSNLKSLIQTPIIKDIDSNLRLSYNEASTKKSPDIKRAKSTSDLSRSVQFEKGTLDTIPRNLTATNERDYAVAFRDNHFYGKKSIPRHTATINEKTDPKYIQLPMTKTLVHDKAWGYGKNYKQIETSYYPFRDSRISKLKK